MPSTRLDHIAIALPRIALAPAALEAVLGGVPDKGGPSGAFRWATWTFAGGGTIEVLEPVGTDGFLHRFLATHGPGVHHVTFKVADLAEACGRAEAAGYDVVGRDESDPSWKEAFLHPKQALGIVVQLAESAAAVEPAGPSASGASGLSEPPRPVRVLGLRLRARSRSRAVTQWSTVLGGDLSELPDGGMVFRWPDSPMRLAVDVDPTASEGSVVLEVVAGRAIPSLDAASDLLGIPLRQHSA